MIRRLLMLVLAGCVLGLAGCVGPTGGDPVESAGLPRDAGADLPRSVEYAGLRWTIDAAAVHLDSRDPSGDREGPTVRLAFTVKSSLDRTKVTYRAEHLALRFPDGALVRADRLELGADGARDRIAVEPGARTGGSAVFAVAEDTDLSVLSFTIDVRDATPAVLPLSGGIPTDPYPLTGTASGRSGPIPDWDSPEPEVDVEALAAHASLDYAHLRAPLGEVFVIIRLRIAGVQGRQHEGQVNDGFFRLLVGDVRLSPAHQFRASAEPGATTELDVAFGVPLGTTSMTLSAGQRGTEVATFPVSVPQSA